jgi:HlyD family secretion protein
MAEPRNSKIKTPVVWIAAAVALVLIFFGVRQMTRERLPVRVGESEVQSLIKTTSTNGRVEPRNNFAAHAPDAGVVKAVYVHAGDRVPAGKLLLQLDDTDAKAKLAAASAALEGAKAALQAVESGGSQRQRVELAGNIANAKLDCNQAASALASVKKLAAQGAAAPSEVAQAEQRLAVATTTLESLERQRSQPFAAIDLEHARSAVD